MRSRSSVSADRRHLPLVCAVAALAAASASAQPPAEREPEIAPREIVPGTISSGTAYDSRLTLIAPLPNETPVGVFVGGLAGGSGARSGDPELCRWALDDWVRNADGRLLVTPAPEAAARLRIYFVAPSAGQYGEMRPMLVNGQRGAEVYVRPNTEALGPVIAAAARADPLLRETIVYLTCLHEIGHALGLEHTAEFADVMYFFGFGGDIPAFFGRYRERLTSRDDIRRQSGLSPGDIARLRALWPRRPDESSAE